MRRIGVDLLFVCAAATSVACSDLTPAAFCTAVPPGIFVQVNDSIAGTPIDSTQVKWVVGGIADSAFVAGSSYRINASVDAADLTVTKSGWLAWTRRVTTSVDQCGSKTAAVSARLQRAP